MPLGAAERSLALRLTSAIHSARSAEPSWNRRLRPHGWPVYCRVRISGPRNPSWRSGRWAQRRQRRQERCRDLTIRFLRDLEGWVRSGRDLPPLVSALIRDSLEQQDYPGGRWGCWIGPDRLLLGKRCLGAAARWRAMVLAIWRALRRVSSRWLVDRVQGRRHRQATLDEFWDWVARTLGPAAPT
jgi:hypothetical protein